MWLMGVSTGHNFCLDVFLEQCWVHRPWYYIQRRRWKKRWVFQHKQHGVLTFFHRLFINQIHFDSCNPNISNDSQVGKQLIGENNPNDPQGGRVCEWHVTLTDQTSHLIKKQEHVKTAQGCNIFLAVQKLFCKRTTKCYSLLQGVSSYDLTILCVDILFIWCW